MVRSLQLFLYVEILLLVINIHKSSSQGDSSELVSSKECEERFKKLESSLQERIKNLETTNRDLQARIKNFESTEVQAAAANKNVVACHSFDLNIECEPGYVISVLQANYGRLSRTICTMGGRAPIHSQHCVSENSKTIVDNYCSGRQNCSILSTNAIFGDPCHGTYKYLEVEYQCKPKAPTKNAVACHSFNLEIECESGYGISVLRANYGRLSRTICNMGGRAPIQSQYCLNDNSKTIVNDLCSGKQNCMVLSTNVIFGDPCPGTYKYLEIEYICIK